MVWVDLFPWKRRRFSLYGFVVRISISLGSIFRWGNWGSSLYGQKYSLLSFSLAQPTDGNTGKGLFLWGSSLYGSPYGFDLLLVIIFWSSTFRREHCPGNWCRSWLWKVSFWAIPSMVPLWNSNIHFGRFGPTLLKCDHPLNDKDPWLSSCLAPVGRILSHHQAGVWAGFGQFGVLVRGGFGPFCQFIHSWVFLVASKYIYLDH